MKILILGSGQVGTTVAQNLAQVTNNDVTVVDIDELPLKNLNSKLDIQTIIGNAASPAILDLAGANDTDLLLALTRSDEINLVACRLADELFNIPSRIARVRHSDYLEFQSDALEAKENINGLLELFNVTESICPEQLVTEQLYELFIYPSALQVINFADGKVQMVVAKAHSGGLLVDKAIGQIYHDLPEGVDCQIFAIYRDNYLITPTPQTVLLNGDEVFFLAATEHVPVVMRELRPPVKSARNVMIAGGGNIGFRLAKILEDDFNVKIIDHNTRRAEFLSEHLNAALVLQGSGTDENLLVQEHIEDIDIFCAITNDDESNIMSSMLAKNLGVKRIITIVNRSSYVNLLQGNMIDIVISPHLITIGSILAHVRRGDVVAVHTLRHGEVEAVEVVIHGDKHTSNLIGRSLDDVKLPMGCNLVALHRENELIMAHKELVFADGDHLVFFVSRRRAIRELEKLIQVKVGFF